MSAFLEVSYRGHATGAMLTDITLWALMLWVLYAA